MLYSVRWIFFFFLQKCEKIELFDNDFGKVLSCLSIVVFLYIICMSYFVNLTFLFLFVWNLIFTLNHTLFYNWFYLKSQRDWKIDGKKYVVLCLIINCAFVLRLVTNSKKNKVITQLCWKNVWYLEVTN